MIYDWETIVSSEIILKLLGTVCETSLPFVTRNNYGCMWKAILTKQIQNDFDL